MLWFMLLMACSGGGALEVGAPPEGPSSAWVARKVRVEQARAAGLVQEGALRKSAVEEALAEGDLDAAAYRLSLLYALPGQTEAEPLRLQLEQRARALPVAASPAAFTLLSELALWSPEGERAAQAFAREARLATRLAEVQPDRLAETIQRYGMVELQTVDGIFEKLEAEYVVEPPWAELVREGDATLHQVLFAPQPLARWPTLSGLQFAPGARVTDRGGLVAHLRGRLRDLPPEVPVGLALGIWLEGSLSALDPHTRVIWPVDLRAWEAGHAGVRLGLGLQLSTNEAGDVLITDLDPASPGLLAGLHQGDVLLSVGEKSGKVVHLAELSRDVRLAAAEAGLIGPPDTAVQLEVRRNTSLHKVELVRAAIPIETVFGWERGLDGAWGLLPEPPSGFGYVRIASFKPETEAAFDAVMGEVPLRGLVLDLRGNRGGDVNAAAQIADRFIADGLLCGLSGRLLPDTGPAVDPQTGERIPDWNEAVPGHAWEGLPLVVLVDRETASAAEVLAGSLQERAGAYVVGAPTFGKGLGQGLRLDPAGRFGLQLSNLVWTLPSGRRLVHGALGGPKGGGIQPDELVELSPGEMAGLRRAAAEREHLKAHPDGTPLYPPTQAPLPIPALSEDPALLAAWIALETRLAK